MKNDNKRAKGFAPWRPQAKARTIVRHTEEILSEYREQLPITLRQIFYRLVAEYDYPKDQKAYEMLSHTLTRARRAELINFEDIRDDGITIVEPPCWSSPDHLISFMFSEAAAYRTNRLKYQPNDIRIWTEAAGMVPQIAKLVQKYGIPVQSSSGQDSVTARYELARGLDKHRPTEILHIGDHDPSGLSIFNVLEEDVTKFAEELGGVVWFKRIAVTEEQVGSLELPTQRRKVTDAKSYPGVFGDTTITCQAEAIAPNVLANIVMAEVEELICRDSHNAALQEEKEAQNDLEKRLETVRQ